MNKRLPGSIIDIQYPILLFVIGYHAGQGATEYNAVDDAKHVE
jgi:hypothetical protein